MDRKVTSHNVFLVINNSKMWLKNKIEDKRVLTRRNYQYLRTFNSKQHKELLILYMLANCGPFEGNGKRSLEI